jgi:hypothetical protein
MRHGVGTCLWPPRQRMQISVVATILFYDDVTATVPAVVIAVPKPPPLPSNLPPCSRSLPGEDFHLSKIRGLLSRFARCQLSNFFFSHNAEVLKP